MAKRKLLDLGLGRLSYDPARVTEHGYLVGAPFYMSPERLTAIDIANERCDIWSFGVTFYEWISGHHPFYDDDGDRMIGNIMDAVPADLQDVPPQLNQVILRAIEKDPNDRYRTFAELLADLQPLIGNIKREESDALMAEALKQTDSGRWHEARRIARQLRDMDNPQQGSPSQIFGISEQELENERARPAAAAASAPAAPVQPLAAAAGLAAATAAAARAATAVDTPEPAPPPAPPVERSQPTPPPPAPAPRAPQRPERTAPKIPSMGVKNGSAAPFENGSPANARVQPAPSVPPANGARAAAAAAAAAPAVVREIDTTPKTQPPRIDSLRPEPTRTRPPSGPQRSAPPIQQQQSTPPPPQKSVRILELEEPSGFPWGKIFAFSIPVLLIIGSLFFFLRPLDKIGHPSANDDAKETTSSGRVIRTDKDDPDSTTPPSATQPVTPPTATATQPDATAPGTPTDTLATTAPRNFDAKSLPTATKVPVPNRRNGKAPLVGVAAPALPGGVEGTEISGLPVAMNAPPPPAPPPQVAVPAKVITPAPQPAAAQTVEAAREAASHIGGVFSQPELAHKVSPVYPPAAVQRKREGKVRFQATIAKDGSVKNIQLLSGDPLLNVAARQAVSQWKYRPAMLNGDPIEVTQTIVIEFNLSNR